MLRNFKHDNQKVFSKPGGYKFRKDRVQVLEEIRQKIVIEKGSAMDLMDLS